MTKKHILPGLILMLLSAFSAHAIDNVTVARPEKAGQEIIYSSSLLDEMTNNALSNVAGDGFTPLPGMPVEMKQKMDSIVGAMETLDEMENYADEIPGKIDKLPMGIRKVVGNLDWTLMLTNLTVGVDGAEISAFLRLITPEGKTLYLGADGVKLNSDGGISDMKLVLLGVVAVPMGNYRLVLRGGTLNKTTGVSDQANTYAIIGCQGLKLINLVGEFELSNNIAYPIKATTNKADKTATVKAPFIISIKNWNDLVVQVSLPDFEMKGLDGVAFKLRNAVLDLSDTRNAAAMKFPEGYQDKYYPGNSMLWRGVYIEELDIKLPEQFEKKDSKVRPEFIGKCMIIDHQGISGKYAVHANILSLNEGSASGWKLSVNSVQIELEANKITKGGFGGEIVLPVSKQDKPSNTLLYTAIITDEDEYLLTVKLKDTLGFDFLMAHVMLKGNSYVTLAVTNTEAGKTKFTPEAVLTGTISISASNSSSGGKMTANGLDFTEFRLMTEAPYFSIKGVEYKGQIGFSNFPVSLSKISMAEQDIDGKKCIALIFNIAVTVAQGKVSGNTTILLSAYYDKPPGSTSDGRWEFYKVKILDVTIHAEFSNLTVDGKIIFMEDDPIYGKAFYGSVAIKYADKFKITSTAMFGSDEFRYWYIDARVDLPVAISVVGPFMLNGFGGGVYSKMSKAPKGSKLPYVPDENASFGVKALVAYVVAKKEVCKGDLMFEMCFNSSGGVKYIAFYGSAEIVAGEGALGGIVSKLNAVNDASLKATAVVNSDKIASGKIQDVASSTDVGSRPASNIFAYVGIQYNFETSTLEATSEVFINLGVLKGSGPNNRAGWMELHISPEKWYCYAGTPEDRLGIVLNLSVVRLQTGSYFMVGTEMPTFPDPPANVVRILGPKLYPLKSNVNEGSLKTGAGFAFGVDLGLSANINFLILYANMSAGVGGDLMLRQYPDAHCEGSADPLGINSWYANGRVYVYLEGEIGVKVDLAFIHAKIPIINGAAAAMLEGGGPNPTWAKGYLRVQFSVLGGKVSGDMNMKMSLGDECKIISNSQAPVSFKVIADISPVSDATEVDVFTSPQIAFNIGVEDAFEVSDDVGTKLFRVKIYSLELTSGGKTLQYSTEWTNQKQTLTLVPYNTLPAKSEVKLTVEVAFEEFKNNVWSPYQVNGASPKETQTISFKTGDAPTNIPHRNIAYMYPAHQQNNVYTQESQKGYIVLKQWQDYLLDGDTKTVKVVKLTAKGKPVLEIATVLNPSAKRIEFDISSLQIQNEYTAELITRPIIASAATGLTSTTSYGDTTSGQYQVVQNNAQNVIQNNGEQSLLLYEFACSKYLTLNSKLADIRTKVTGNLVYLMNVDYINVRTRNYEPFDSTELYGSVYTAGVPLISYQAQLKDAYYTNAVFPAIYKDYPYVTGVGITYRDVSAYGFPPARALYADPGYEADPARMPYIDALVDVYRKDYKELENQVLNLYVGGNYSLLTKYPQFFSRFPEPPASNNEQVEFTYMMPGNAAGTKGLINYIR